MMFFNEQFERGMPVDGILEEKTYELYVVNKSNDDSKVMYLQVLNGNLIIDMEVRQLFYGSIEDYMKYCNYDLQSIEERDIPSTRKLDIVDSCPIFF